MSEQTIVKLVDVYDGEELPPRYEPVAVPPPESWQYDDEGLEDWAYDNIFVLTGTGQPHEESAYFAVITECPSAPELVGREFEWGT